MLDNVPYICAVKQNQITSGISKFNKMLKNKNCTSDLFENLVDFHCHLDIYQNFISLIDECERRKIYTLAVTTTPRAWKKNNELAQKTKYVRAALGLHPQLVAQYHHETDLLCSLIVETAYIGEIGLDGSAAYNSSIHLQISVFDRILKACANHGGRILSIHSRCAGKLVLDMLEKHKQCDKAVLHWFSGSQDELTRAITLGCWFSVGPLMLNSKKGINIVRRIPMDRILTETDGPFATDNKIPLMPWDTINVVGKLSLLWDLEVLTVKNKILSNFHSLIS